MIRRNLLLVFSTVSIGIRISNAQVVLHESFDYTTGVDLAAQSSAVWVNVNSGDTVSVVSGNLSVPGLQASAGNSASFAGAGIDPHRTFTARTSTTWYSLVINVVSLGSLNSTGGYFFGVGDNSTTFGATVWTRSDGAGFDVGINQRTTAAQNAWSSGTQAVGSTIFLVGNYVLNSGTGNDVANLWINPSSDSFGGTEPAATLTSSGASADLTQVQRIFLRQDSTTTTPNLVVDEIRVGNSWADVTPVPEPSEYVALTSAGLIGFALWRRRAARKA